MVLAALALLAFGFLKGMQWEQGKQAVAESSAYQEMLVNIHKKAKEDRAAAAKFADERNKLKERNRKLDQQIEELIRNRPQYKDPKCDIEQDVADVINKMISGDKK
jgi:predicted negative regulator of RcsB-dependent stress response